MSLTAEIMKSWREGKAEGIIEGRAEGEAIGEVKATLSIVEKLLLAKTPIDFIMEVTGWTREKILAVAQNRDDGVEF